MLSSFIEAKNVTVAASGGVKRDDVNPSGETKKGFGHVPFHRDEYAGEITAYFNLDVAQIRGFRLGEQAEKLLIALALFKVQKVLEVGLRLRTACDLELMGAIRVKRPDGFIMPPLGELEKELPALIAAASDKFATPPVTTVRYTK